VWAEENFIIKQQLEGFSFFFVENSRLYQAFYQHRSSQELRIG
jgi:hypothetical protein